MSLRPMSSSEVLDFSLRVYQNLGWMILKLTAIPATFVFGGLAFLFWIVLPKLGVTSSPGDIGVQVSEAVLTLLVAFAAAIPIIMIGFSFSSAIIVKLVSTFIEGALPDPAAATRVARQSFWPMLKLTVFEALVGCSGIIASTLVIMVSAILDAQSPNNAAVSGAVSAIGIFGYLVGFFVFLAVLSRHALTGPIVVLEGKSAKEAAKRSAQLLKSTSSHPSGYGAIWMAFFVIGILSLILLPAFYGLLGLVDLQALIANFSGVPILGEALATLLNMTPLYLLVWVCAPIWCATSVILYFERRIRLEGYDIESLARDMVRNRKESRFEF